MKERINLRLSKDLKDKIRHRTIKKDFKTITDYILYAIKKEMKEEGGKEYE